MRTDIFYIDTYLQKSEAYHFTRKTLVSAPPKLRHSHDYYELLLIERGKARHFINDTTEPLARGDMVFMRPQDCHALQADRHEGCHIINVMFRQETADHLIARYGDEFADAFFWFDGELPQRTALDGPQLERAVNWLNDLRGTISSLARIELCLLSLMTHVMDTGFVSKGAIPDWLAHACRAAHDPEVFRQGSAGLVAEAGRAHEHVARKMQQHLGMSPTHYINRLRIQYAAMQLTSSPTPIEAIAYDCGFENMSYFHRLFRDQYGTTPGAYRKRRRRDPVTRDENIQTAVAHDGSAR